MAFKITLKKEQLPTFVLQKIYEQGEWKKVYDLDELECVWETEGGKEVLIIRPKENLKELRQQRRVEKNAGKDD